MVKQRLRMLSLSDKGFRFSSFSIIIDLIIRSIELSPFPFRFFFLFLFLSFYPFDRTTCQLTCRGEWRKKKVTSLFLFFFPFFLLLFFSRYRKSGEATKTIYLSIRVTDSFSSSLLEKKELIAHMLVAFK